MYSSFYSRSVCENKNTIYNTVINSILFFKNSQHTFAKSVRYIQHFSSQHICSCQFIYANSQLSICKVQQSLSTVISQVLIRDSLCTKCLRLSIHVSVCSCLHTTVISQVSMCRRDHGRRTSPDDGRMPENLCRLPTRNAYHHKMIGKF